MIHLGEKDQKCTLCDFSSALKVDLTKHIREAHERKNQQHEQGPIINRKEETKANNDSVQDFSSDEFNEDFSSDEFNEDRDPLEVNLSVEMKYKCTYCSVSFLTTENVKEHTSIVHEGKKWIL